MISIPTGTVETEIMQPACFELKVEKALIVVPSRVLRRQISEQCRNMVLLKKLGCL